MRLSIIIPVFNEAPYLHRCLGSVAAALDGHTDAEVIVVDDGSTDGSTDICEEYAEVFKIYKHPHKGVSHARNYGMFQANGEWLAFIDSDDEMLPNGIATMLSEMSNGHDVIQLEHFRHYEKSNKTVMKYMNAHRWYKFGDMPKCWFAVWNKLYKRTAIEGLTFNEEIHYGEDELFNLHAIWTAGGVYCTDGAAIIRHFDNKQSLNHLKGRDELLSQAHVLLGVLEQTTDPDMSAYVRWLLANHFDSETYKKVFGA